MDYKLAGLSPATLALMIGCLETLVEVMGSLGGCTGSPTLILPSGVG